jgi:dihydrofolate reductase
MGNLGAGFSMSLDGFIAGPNDEVDQVFSWMFRGDTDVKATIGEHDIDLKISKEDAEAREEMAQSMGAIISGRRIFDVAGAWGGKHPLNVPIVVLTHHPETISPEWKKAGMPFTFVTDLESAVAAAQKIAGDKSIGVAGANVAQQCLKAGLLDEIGIDLVPVLIGQGIPFFKHLGVEPIHLEITGGSQSPGVTHLRYRVIKQK